MNRKEFSRESTQMEKLCDCPLVRLEDENTAGHWAVCFKHKTRIYFSSSYWMRNTKEPLEVTHEPTVWAW